jgi:hypothetical protein
MHFWRKEIFKNWLLFGSFGPALNSEISKLCPPYPKDASYRILKKTYQEEVKKCSIVNRQ